MPPLAVGIGAVVASAWVGGAVLGATIAGVTIGLAGAAFIGGLAGAAVSMIGSALIALRPNLASLNTYRVPCSIERAMLSLFL